MGENRVRGLLTSIEGVSGIYNLMSERDDVSLKKSNHIRNYEWKVLKSVQVLKDPLVSLAIIKEFSQYIQNTSDSGDYPPRFIDQKVEKISFCFFRGAADFLYSRRN